MATSPTEATILLVDPLPLRHFGLVALLDRLSTERKARLTTVSPDEAKRSIRRGAGCRLIIYNVGGSSVSERHHIKQIRALKARAADVPLVILSDSNDRKEVLAAFSAGAQGFLFAGSEADLALQGLSFVFGGGSYFTAAVNGRQIRLSRRHQSGKSRSSPVKGTPAADLAEAPHAPLGNPAGSELTEKQRLVLEGVSRGDPNKVIARRLGIREGTVKVHVRQIMRKLGVGNRTQIAIACRLPTPPRKE